MAFAQFAAKHLIAVPYIEDDRVVFVPVLMGREFGYVLGLHPDYTKGTWVALGFDGHVSVNISKDDYLTYTEDLSFDQLCESLGNLFIDFLDLFKRGQSVRIIDRMDALGLSASPRSRRRCKMDFKTAAKLGSYIAKDYAEDLFELLVNYRDISASEAASRLNLHIRTAQDFLEAMASLDILTKEKVHEGKRPYFRYSLKRQRITMELDLTEIKRGQSGEKLTKKIREKKNSGARFSTARNDQYISSLAIWIGEGRERKERRISLTMPQSKFLYHLPFPNAEHLSISEIMRKAKVDATLSPEILDMVELLEKYEVIEAQ